MQYRLFLELFFSVFSIQCYVSSKADICASEDVPFTISQCSYGYDRTHNQTSDTGVAIAADRPPTNPVADPAQNSPNHEGSGQHVVYIDGHVEFVATPTAGWYFQDGTRDHIFLDTALTGTSTVGGTDTVILHDG